MPVPTVLRRLRMQTWSSSNGVSVREASMVYEKGVDRASVEGLSGNHEGQERRTRRGGQGEGWLL